MLKKATSRFFNRITRNYYDGYNNNKIYLVAVTGGPCAGKTTALMNITENFSMNYKVFSVPEMATIAINGGVNLVPNKPLSERKHLAKQFIKNVISMENYFIEAAKVEKSDVLILCDRGVMDIKAYIEYEAFDEILQELEYTEDQMTSERYDLVCHMVTVADGYEEFYQLKNNRARSETPAQARDLDKTIQEVWMNHQNFRIQSAQSLFDNKIDDIYSAIANLLKMDSSYQMSEKYLQPNDLNIEELQPNETNKASFYEKINYLIHNDGIQSVYIKERINNQGGKVYSHVIRNKIDDNGKKFIKKNKITKEIYDLFMKQKNPYTESLYRKLTSFIDNNENYVILEYYDDLNYTNKVHTILMTEPLINSKRESFKVPSFFTEFIQKNLTGDDKYTSYYIAQRNSINK